MMHRRALLIFAYFCLSVCLAQTSQGANLWENPPQVGDVVVTATAAPLQTGSKVIDRTEVGITLDVLQVNGDWLRVVYHVTGWIHKKYVVPGPVAVEYFSARIEENPSDVAFLNARGNAFSLLGDCDAAVADFHKALEIRPLSPWIHNNCGVALMKAERYEEAITEFTIALVGHGKFDAIVHTNRGICYARAGAQLRARMSFGMAIGLNPLYPPAYERMAWLETLPPQHPLQRVFGGGANAVAYAKRACELTNNRGAKYLSTLAATYAQTGQLEEAVKYQTQALEVAPASQREVFQEQLDAYQAGLNEPGTV